MNTPEDKQLSSLYKQTEQEMPAPHVDDAILSAAKRETKKYSLPFNPFSNDWHIPVSLVAVLVLSFGIVSLMENDLTSVDGVPPLSVSETELFQAPLETIDESGLAEEASPISTPGTLAKVPKKTHAKPAPRQLAAKSPQILEKDTNNIELKQGLLSLRNREIKRDEQLARKKKQQSQKASADNSDRISLAAAMPLSAPQTITTGTDEQAMLPYWQYKDEGMSIRLVQRLPDQTRGYFVARGFSAEHAELIAQSCVFQTVFKNISDQGKPSAIVYNMENWIVTHNGKAGEMKTREKWAAQWQKLNVAPPAKLAFEWSLLPTTQDYQPGDYNWGMSVFNLEPASSFSLKLTWQQYGEQRSVTIPNMQCAADFHADPEAP